MAEKREKSELRQWVESVAIALITALLIKHFVFEFVLVDGLSMYPTLNNGDRLLVTKFNYYFDDPEFQDIIILNYDDHLEFVKRIIGCPGDTVEIKNSVVYLNGEPLKEDYIDTDPYGDFEEVVVPEGEYFVLGDNRDQSKDSRFADVGFISEDDILGKVVCRIYPFKDAGAIQ